MKFCSQHEQFRIDVKVLKWMVLANLVTNAGIGVMVSIAYLIK